jgi:ABC-type nitrate/sulfonate/bicarbonate transport system substrate-binding protein/DNA-binding transcriptional LysR family regulator
MNFQQLRTILELPRHSFNLSQMASAMGMTQPGISRHVRDMEDAMGFAIFERSGKRISGLSDSGRAIMPIVERLLIEAGKLQGAGVEYTALASGVLGISTTHTQARYALPQAMLGFRGAFPDVRIALQQNTPEDIAKSVIAGKADIGIATEGLAAYPELAAFPCYRWSHLVLVPDGHPLLELGPLTLRALVQFPLLTYDHGFTGRRHIDQAFATTGLSPDVVLTAMDSDVIKDYVRLGLGVGVLASVAFDAEHDAGLRALDAGHLFAASTTWLAVRRGAYLRSYTYEFIRHFAPQLTRQAIDLELHRDTTLASDATAPANIHRIVQPPTIHRGAPTMSTTIDTLWYTRCPAPTPFGIAIQQGWLAQEFAADGLQIRALQDADDPAIRRSHFTHSQPHSFRQGGNIPALWARSSGAATRVIGLTWVDEFQGLLALRGSGIASVEQLRGKRFGLPKNLVSGVVDFHRATALRGFSTLLDVAGLTLDDVKLVDLPYAPLGLADARPVDEQGFARLLRTHGQQEFSREVHALISGEVDVVFAKGATGLAAANLAQADVIVDISQQKNRLLHANNGAPRPLTVDQALLDARPDLVARVLARTIDAGRWAESHPTETTAYIARETKSPELWVRHAYGPRLHHNLHIDLAPGSVAALDNFKQFLHGSGYLPTDFDIEQWIDPQPLRQALQLLETRQDSISTELAA